MSVGLAKQRVYNWQSGPRTHTMACTTRSVTTSGTFSHEWNQYVLGWDGAHIVDAPSSWPETYCPQSKPSHVAKVANHRMLPSHVAKDIVIWKNGLLDKLVVHVKRNCTKFVTQDTENDRNVLCLILHFSRCFFLQKTPKKGQGPYGVRWNGKWWL